LTHLISLALVQKIPTLRSQVDKSKTHQVSQID